jgi:hypothetical protein
VLAQEDSFDVTFYKPDNMIQITLNQLPFGAARLSAETVVKDITGLSEEELCRASIFVGAPIRLDPKQSEFGLSFCPGSIDLTWY